MREILRLGCEGDPALERLASLEPSTLTLVRMTHYMVRYFLQATEADPTERELAAAPGPAQLSRRR